MRNNIYTSILFVLLCSWFTSCTDVLDKEPLGVLDADNYFKTAEDAIQGINAAYHPLLMNNENNNFYWVFGTLAAEEALAGGDGSRPGIIAIDVMSHTPSTQEINDFWKLNYAGIVQANTVISKTPQVDADQDLKNRIIGEGLFLRSYYHFILTQVFGDVPLILKIQTPDEVNVIQTSKAAVWAQIAADCELAATLLPLSYSGNDVGRATKGAALALAAKAYLYLKDYQSVLNRVSDIKALTRDIWVWTRCGKSSPMPEATTAAWGWRFLWSTNTSQSFGHFQERPPTALVSNRVTGLPPSRMSRYAASASATSSRCCEALRKPMLSLK